MFTLCLHPSSSSFSSFLRRRPCRPLLRLLLPRTISVSASPATPPNTQVHLWRCDWDDRFTLLRELQHVFPTCQHSEVDDHRGRWIQTVGHLLDDGGASTGTAPAAAAPFPLPLPPVIAFAQQLLLSPQILSLPKGMAEKNAQSFKRKERDAYFSAAMVAGAIVNGLSRTMDPHDKRGPPCRLRLHLLTSEAPIREAANGIGSLLPKVVAALRELTATGASPALSSGSPVPSSSRSALGKRLAKARYCEPEEKRHGFHKIAAMSRLERRDKDVERFLSGAFDRGDAFTSTDILVQIAVATKPGTLLLSVSPMDTTYALRKCLSRFPAGMVVVPPHAAAAPSSAYAKLIEAEIRIGGGNSGGDGGREGSGAAVPIVTIPGAAPAAAVTPGAIGGAHEKHVSPLPIRRIEKGHTVVDLGCIPGGWTYVCLQRGAHVTAVDRTASLAPALRAHRNLAFLNGDAFAYTPPEPVDWLICDVLTTPEKTLLLLATWLDRRYCRSFIVTMKFQGDPDVTAVQAAKAFLDAYVARGALEYEIRKMNANKNEVTIFGFFLSSEIEGPSVNTLKKA